MREVQIFYAVYVGLTRRHLQLPPGLWLTSPAGWLPRTCISSGTIRSEIEYGLPLPLFSAWGVDLTRHSGEGVLAGVVLTGHRWDLALRRAYIHASDGHALFAANSQNLTHHVQTGPALRWPARDNAPCPLAFITTRRHHSSLWCSLYRVRHMSMLCWKLCWW